VSKGAFSRCPFAKETLICIIVLGRLCWRRLFICAFSEISQYLDDTNYGCNNLINKLTPKHTSTEQHTNPGDTLYQYQKISMVSHGLSSFRVDLQPFRTVLLQPCGPYFYTPGTGVHKYSPPGLKRGYAALTTNHLLNRFYKIKTCVII